MDSSILAKENIIRPPRYKGNSLDTAMIRFRPLALYTTIANFRFLLSIVHAFDLARAYRR